MKTVKIKLKENYNDFNKLIIDDNITILFDEIMKKSETIVLTYNGENIVTFANEDYEKLLEVFEF